MSDRPVVTYDDLSQRALLAIALLGVEDWRRARDLRDPNLDALVQHLWDWMTVGPRSFDEWCDWESPALEFALEPRSLFPFDMAGYWAAAGCTEAQARGLLAPLVELVDDHLFTAIDRDQLLARFKDVRRQLAVDGILFRPPTTFADSPATELDGWGRRLDDTGLRDWRSR
ncbi:hypothetical protein [Aquihabitans sp. McL0605]|uniref:hypothetical protein n=1 Tax=Aquihabitans sp. McL0605 TaxID=3415671 RepID=UPI003CF29060